MPDFLCGEMQDYFKQLYGLEPDSRIFPLTKHTLKRGMEFGCKTSGVKVIRIHDLRHSKTPRRRRYCAAGVSFFMATPHNCQEVSGKIVRCCFIVFSPNQPASRCPNTR